MKVICPNCNVPMEMSDVVTGTNIKCAACDNVFLAGRAGSSTPPTPPPAPALLAPATEIERTPCPFCSHMVAKGAVKCPKCKEAIIAVFCPSCRESIHANAFSCPHCQTKIRQAPATPATPAPQPQRKCPTCHTLYPSPISACEQCRIPLGPTPQSKIVCAIIALIIPFGIHRFMMGYTTIGILQIAVVTITCGMGCIWPFIEGFLILTGSLKMADGQDLLDS